MKDGSPGESVHRVSGEIDTLRGDIGNLVAELDRRRHEMFDLRLQAKRHPMFVLAASAGAALVLGGLIALAVRTRRERRSPAHRAREVRSAMARLLDHPDRVGAEIILIGEMRDHETVSAALTAAEIGNLVLSTLHTIDATETINRIIDFFPPYQQKQVRLMLAATLKGIVSLRLIPSMQGGLVPAVEVLVMTGTVREYITDPDKTYMIRDAMEEGEYYGMHTFDQSLLDLYVSRKITLDDAIAMSQNAHDFKIKVRQLGTDPHSAAESGVY